VVVAVVVVLWPPPCSGPGLAAGRVETRDPDGLAFLCLRRHIRITMVGTVSLAVLDRWKPVFGLSRKCLIKKKKN
jgi:hypothetical protein